MDDKEEFGRYTSFYPEKGDTRPYVCLWVGVNERYTREPRDNDEWDAGERAEELQSYGVELRGGPEKAEAKPGRWGSRDVCLDESQLGFMPQRGQVVRLVIEEYCDGCTFGSTSPIFKPVRIFKTGAEARAWTESDEAGRYKFDGYFGGHIGFRVELVEVE